MSESAPRSPMPVSSPAPVSSAAWAADSADPGRRSSPDRAPAPPARLDRGAIEAWMLDPRISYLNHGSFGARLRSVVDAQARHRAELEAGPVAYLDRERDERAAAARRSVGEFLGMDPSRFGFVLNASDGINAVLRSLPWRSGDEIVTTSHVYNAVRRTLAWLASVHDVVPIEARVPLPVDGPAAIVSAIADRITARTRLLLVDHVTSESAMILPAREIVALGRDRDIPVFIDGAHAPGMLPLDVEAIGADYYTGNLHKWVGAPLGSAFLHVRAATADEAPPVHPTIISHFHGEPMAAEFAWQGTRDVSSFLTAPDAITAMASLDPERGWPGVRAHNDQLLAWAEAHLCEAWSVSPIVPPAMRGSMATIPLPRGIEPLFADVAALKASLYDDDAIEVPIMQIDERWHLRISAQTYNRPEEYARLADAVLRRLR